ncbi:hypothetical protein N9W76_00655 [Planktomarina temperata]|nr:hypothetical protein [Planktomarina temperata]
MADLREQLFELLDCKICVGERVRIGWPVGYFLGHLVKNIPNFLAQFHRKLLRGTRLTLVRVNFVERPVISHLCHCQSKGCLSARIGRAWLFLVISCFIQNDIKPQRDKRAIGRRIQTVFTGIL